MELVVAAAGFQRADRLVREWKTCIHANTDAPLPVPFLTNQDLNQPHEKDISYQH
jgi:hypothetical protein